MFDLDTLKARNDARVTGFQHGQQGIDIAEAYKFQETYPQGLLRRDYMTGYHAGNLGVKAVKDSAPVQERVGNVVYLKRTFGIRG